VDSSLNVQHPVACFERF